MYDIAILDKVGHIKCSIKPDIPASKVYTELLGQGFTQGGFAGARRPMK
jgi:hypothetical protein